MIIGSYFADRVEDKRPFLSALLVFCAVGWIGMGLYATSAWALDRRHAGRDRYRHRSADVLDGAAVIPERRRHGGRHRADQRLRQFRRDHRSRRDWLAQDDNEQLLRRAVLCGVLCVRIGYRDLCAAHETPCGTAAVSGPLMRLSNLRRCGIAVLAVKTWQADWPQMGGGS